MTRNYILINFVYFLKTNKIVCEKIEIESYKYYNHILQINFSL